jgi:hypothetical protein
MPSSRELTETLKHGNLNRRTTARAAGYMELDGAVKTGDCNAVEVKGGVSGEKGCSNLFDPIKGATEFECEQCKHFRSKEN